MRGLTCFLNVKWSAFLFQELPGVGEHERDDLTVATVHGRGGGGAGRQLPTAASDSRLAPPARPPARPTDPPWKTEPVLRGPRPPTGATIFPQETPAAADPTAPLRPHRLQWKATSRARRRLSESCCSVHVKRHRVESSVLLVEVDSARVVCDYCGVAVRQWSLRPL